MSSNSNKRDYYDVLGIAKNATEDEIKSAFKKMAIKYHPDRNKDPDATEKFKEINEAYQILSNKEKRELYDRFGHAGLEGNPMGQGFSGMDPFTDIFDMFFGGGMGGRRQRGGFQEQRQQGEDIELQIELSFEEAVKGCEKNIEYHHYEPCPECNGLGALNASDIDKCSVCNGSGQRVVQQRTVFGVMQQVTTCNNCRGTGQIIRNPCPKCFGKKMVLVLQKTLVKLPGGVDTGMRMRVDGHGHYPSRNAIPGDLFVEVRVKPHKVFQRDENNNIILNITIDVPLAIFGGEMTVPTIDGPVSIKIPPGTSSGTELRLRGKGIPSLERRGKDRGDQYVHVNVKIPKPEELSGDTMSHYKGLESILEKERKPIEIPQSEASDDSAGTHKHAEKRQKEIESEEERGRREYEKKQQKNEKDLNQQKKNKEKDEKKRK